MSVIILPALTLSIYAETNRAVVVSAPRLESLDIIPVDTAADTSIIKAETIRNSGAVFVPELLRNEANVLIRSTSGNSADAQVSFRGFGENSHVRTLFLLDGYKLNRPDLGGIAWWSLPVGNIERIEVIRGGQNVLYGNHALAGVIHIATRKPAVSGWRMDGAFGSFGYRSASAGFGIVTDDADLALRFGSVQSDGFRTNSGFRGAVFNANAAWYANETDVLTLQVMLGQARQQFPGPLTYEQMRENPRRSNNPGNESARQDAGRVSLLYETERHQNAGQIRLGWNRRELESALSGQYAQNNQTGVSLAPRIRFGGTENFLMAGFDGFFDRLNVENYYDEKRSVVESFANISRFTTAPYLFFQKTAGEKTVLNGGVRLEYAGTDHRFVQYDETQIPPLIGPFPNPDYRNPPEKNEDASYEGYTGIHGWAAELSVSQMLTPQWKAFAGYDRVYRYPALDETASYQGFPLSVPLNADLEPEHGNNIEIGTRFAHRNWEMTLTGFFMMLENEIAYVEYTDRESGQRVQFNDNIGATRRLGIESAVKWKQEYYGASTRWTLVDARFSAGENRGNRVPLVPLAYGVASAWIDPVPRLRLTLRYTVTTGQFQGNDEENVQRKLDAYGLFGLRVNLALNDETRLTINMENLLDSTYSSTAYSGGFYPSSGRNFRIGMAMEF